MTKDTAASRQPEEAGRRKQSSRRRRSGDGRRDEFRDIFDSAPDFTVLLQPDGVVIDANRRALELGGCELNHLVGRSFWDLGWWNPQQRDELRSAIAEAASGRPAHRELELRGPHHPTVVFDVALRPIQDERGGTVRLVAHARDVSQQKGVAAALRESETVFRDAFDYAAIGMALSSTDGRFLKVNRSFCRIVGYAEEDLLRTTVQAIAHRDDLQSDLIVLRRLLGGEISFYHLEKRFIHKNGDLVFAQESVSVARDAHGRPMHLLRQVQDITARKEAEEAMRRDRDFTKSLIETAQAIVLVLDTNEHILRFNPFTAQLTGYRMEEVCGRDWSETLVPPHARELARRVFDGAMRGITPQSTAYTIASKDGAEHEIEWSGRALTDNQGATTAVLFIGHDISRLRETQRRLLESERLAAIGQMASGIAHESRNALQQVGACAEMLLMELEGQPVALDLVDGVQEACDRLHRMFEDVRAYAVPQRMERATAKVRDIWRDAWSQLKQSHPQRHMSLHDACEAVDTSVRVSRPALRTAFFNIFENSVDVGSDPLLLEIHCDEAALNGQPALAISIRDNGPGLSDEQQRRILEPFYTTKTQGTGLGMSIVKRIIDAHGGRLEVPQQPDEGAEFRILLPRDV